MAIKLSLTSVPVFQFVSPTHTQKLAGIAKVIEKQRGEAVLLHGETVPGIYIVAEGEMGVYPPGTVRPLVSLAKGDSFGEMSFLEKTKASATIRAEAASKLVVMMQSDLGAMVDADADLGRALYRGMALTLSRKLRMTTDKIAGELQVGRKLLKELATDGDAATSLATLPSEVTNQNQLVLDSLDSAIRLADDLAKRIPERAGTVSEMQLKLAESRSLCSGFYPRLSRQITAITSFIKSMEEFILHSTRD